MPFRNRPRTKPINTPKRNSPVNVSIFVDVIGGGSRQICFITLNDILFQRCGCCFYNKISHTLRMIILHILDHIAQRQTYDHDGNRRNKQKNQGN